MLTNTVAVRGTRCVVDARYGIARQRKPGSKMGDGLPVAVDRRPDRADRVAFALSQLMHIPLHLRLSTQLLRIQIKPSRKRLESWLAAGSQRKRDSESLRETNLSD